MDVLSGVLAHLIVFCDSWTCLEQFSTSETRETTTTSPVATLYQKRSRRASWLYRGSPDPSHQTP